MSRAAALTLLLLGAGSRTASAEAGRTAAVFLRRALGARAAALGGAYAAVADGGPESTQYNPALVAALRRPALTTSYLSGFGGTSHGHLGWAQPLPYGTAAVGLLYFNAGSISVNRSDGQTGTVTAEEDTAWTLSYAAPLFWGFSAGGTYRYLRLDLAEAAHAVTHQTDMGLFWKPPIPYLTLGGAYQYWGPDIRFEEAGDPPPKTLRYGAAFRFPDLDAKVIDPKTDLEAFDMTVAADMVQSLFEPASPRAGLELGLTPAFMTRVALRFGYVLKRYSEGLTFGAGFRHGNVGFDYAYGSARDLPGLQNLTLTISF